MFSRIKQLLEIDYAAPMNMEVRVEIAINLTYLFCKNKNQKGFIEEIRNFSLFAEYARNTLTDESERDLPLLLAYGIFKVIFHEDPFWGKETMCRYPFVTHKVKEKVYREDRQYVFHPEGLNNYPDLPEYENAKLVMRFLPGYFVKTFENAFVYGVANAELVPSCEQWVRVVRRLRDDLMNSDKPPFFICWDKDGGFSPKVNYLQIKQQHISEPDSPEEYLWAIPMKEGKKIYKYHVSSRDSETIVCEDEPVAVFLENNKINKLGQELWLVRDKRNELYLDKITNNGIIDLESRYYLVWTESWRDREKKLFVAEEMPGNSIVKRWRAI